VKSAACCDKIGSTEIAAMAGRPDGARPLAGEPDSSSSAGSGLPRQRGEILRLTLLGGFHLQGAQGDIHLGSGKLCGLLAFLACTAPAPQFRDRLMSLFWGSRLDAQARQSLRQALTRLRRVLGEGIIASNEEVVALEPHVLSCDVIDFEAALRDGSPNGLEAAVALYRGEFLSNVAIQEEDWSEWLTVQRQRLEAQALGAMIRLGDVTLGGGNAGRALDLAERAVGIDALVEEAQRLSFRALAGVGRRAEALKRYEQFVAKLKLELNVAPETKTQALAAELRTSGTHATVTILSTDAANIAVAPLDRPSIAVLPFANLSGDPNQEYFADGMVDDILSALSHVRWLFVIARQSSFIYKTRSADMTQIGRELGVRYAVEGSVRRDENRVRVTAQLIETETGAHIWADRYDGDLRDIFALQDELTEKIAAAVEFNVQAAEVRRARAKPTDSLTAYDLYLRALPAYFGQTKEDYKLTGFLLSHATEIDPEYSEALGLLTDSVAVRTLLGWHESWSGGVDEACRLADRAVAAAPDNGTCLATAAFTYGILARRFDEAFELANRAVALYPNSVLVRYRTGAVYAVCGEADKAISQCEAASRMNPLASKKAATATYSTLSCALYFAGRYDDCLDAGRRALALAPQDNIARKYVAMSLGQLGRSRDAQTEIAELVKLQSDATIALLQQQGFRHKWMHELHVEGLRKAGLREE
jgi:TolB-like protein